MDENKKKSLELAIKQIDKQFGKGTILRMGDREIEPIDAINTGSLGLDLALGIGGVPKGRIVEIYGPESSGKTTLTLHLIAQCQKAGGVCAFVDAEHALDPNYAKNLGVDIDNLYISQPDFGEQALDVVETLARSGAVDLIVVDSVAALTPKNEIDGDMGDQHVGLQARLMSQALRKLTSVVHKMGAAVIFINQIRMKIGGMGYGTPETTTGGNALKFYSSVRIDVRRIATLKQGDDPVGNRVRVKVVKNKVAPPFKQAEFDIMFGEGISREGELMDYGVKLDIIDKSGAWFSYASTKLGQGRENAKAFLKENE
ncbi:MAG: recombinase RecA, partial [Campylobacter sp.]